MLKRTEMVFGSKLRKYRDSLPIIERNLPVEGDQELAKWRPFV